MARYFSVYDNALGAMLLAGRRSSDTLKQCEIEQYNIILFARMSPARTPPRENLPSCGTYDNILQLISASRGISNTYRLIAMLKCSLKYSSLAGKKDSVSKNNPDACFKGSNVSPWSDHYAEEEVIKLPKIVRSAFFGKRGNLIGQLIGLER